MKDIFEYILKYNLGVMQTFLIPRPYFMRHIHLLIWIISCHAKVIFRESFLSLRLNHSYTETEIISSLIIKGGQNLHRNLLFSVYDWTQGFLVRNFRNLLFSVYDWTQGFLVRNFLYFVLSTYYDSNTSNYTYYLQLQYFMNVLPKFRI